jgi:hypothetical protein
MFPSHFQNTTDIMNITQQALLYKRPPAFNFNPADQSLLASFGQAHCTDRLPPMLLRTAGQDNAPSYDVRDRSLYYPIAGY